MELINTIRYMCRICAVNIKNTSSAVSILETTQLTEKLKKYLNIDIIYNDVLPKCICSVCYKKVEAIHALAALAKKTENFLTDFIKIAQNNLKNQQIPLENLQTITNQNDIFNQFSLLDNNDCINDNDIICCDDDQRSSEPEEVVLNFTLNDPLTKNIQKKIVVAKQKKQQKQQNYTNQQRQQHQKYQHDLSQYSTSITPTISPTKHHNELIREIQAFKRNELINNTSLEQKRQNLKMILNNNTTNNSTVQQKNTSPESTTSTNNYKLIIPNSGNGSGSAGNLTPSGGHSINVAVQIQQQPPLYTTTNQQQHAELMQHQQQHHQQQSHKQTQNFLINNSRTAQMINDCLNLGSVIKDMDLLKLILKALKWPFNTDTLNTQIQRLKNTRFRDVMIDPNLLQDTDLMQILSSYLSPILLQTSPISQQTIPATNLLASPSSSATSTTAANILPPSVSYKIPAETSVRLVCVPRDEQQQQHQQNEHQQQQQYELEKLQQQLSSQATISSSSQSMKKHQLYNFDYEQYKSKKQHKSKKKHLKNLSSDNYYHHHRRLQQQQHQNYEPIIILSDESHDYDDNSSDNIQKFEVNVDPMLYFNGADSSYENSNESTMITMGYFKQHHQQQQQQQQQQQNITSFNSEVTLQQKRKKQKRKQTLIKNPINKNILDQEILIIDENGEKPIQLNNEILCIPSKNNKYKDNLPSTSSKSSKNYNSDNDYLINIPSTSASINNNEKYNKEITNFEFTTPKKKRKLNTLKSSSSKDVDIFKLSKNKVPRSDSMVIIHKPDLTKIDNKLPLLHKEIKLEKNLNDVSIIAVNKNYESTKKLIDTTNNKPIVELMPKKQHQNNDDNNKISLKLVENIVEKLEKNIIIQNETKKIIENSNESKTAANDIEKIIEEKEKEEKNKELSENIEDDNLKIVSSSCGGGDDDADSIDTNCELVIDEGYDEEKIKEDENKIDNKSCNEQDTPKLKTEETESKLNLSEIEEIKNTDENISKTTRETNDSIENNTLRRSRRQTKFKTPIMKSVRKTTNTIKKNLVTTGAAITANVKKPIVSTRGKTRQQEQQKTKMQTRNSNISQRGREQKPFTKYAKKK